MAGRSQSRAGNVRNRGTGAASRAAVIGDGADGDDLDDGIDASAPIGFLAAVGQSWGAGEPGNKAELHASAGTTRAKKPIYRSRKFCIICPIFGIITALVRAPPGSACYLRRY